jgi:hypothetical protein
MRKINKQTREKIVYQSIQEIEFSEKHKETIIEKRWAPNERLYYGIKNPSVGSRSNVMLPKGQGFVDTLLSKIRSAPYLNFQKTEEADYEIAEKINALWRYDSETNDWAFKDLLNKKNAILYGRAIFEYHASSVGGYKSVLSIVDPYDFLIDPACGGTDIEKARFIGRKNIIKSEEDLTSNKNYFKKEVSEIIESYGANVDEDKNKDNRYYSLKVPKQKIHTDNEKKLFSFVEWYTTYKGERYYVLLHKESRKAVRLEKMKDVFKSCLYPFSTYATSPDANEFWTPSPMDAVRELFLTQNVVINQMLDNNEQINKPMRAFNVNAIEHPSLLKYRKDGLVPVRNTFKPSDIHTFETPQITTPVTVYNILESIGGVESGITADAKGVSNTDRVGILESNLANVADRLGLLNRSYSNAYKRLGLLYYHGVREHLTGKKSVAILGKKGVSYKQISRSEIVDKKTFNVLVSSSVEEAEVDIAKKREKISFLQSQINNPMINQKSLFRVMALTAGLDPVDIEVLLNPSDSTYEIVGKAAQDIQTIINGGFPQIPRKVEPTYMEEFIKFIDERGADLKEKVLMEIIRYIEIIRPMAAEHEIKRAQTDMLEMMTRNPGEELLPGQQTGQERIVREQMGE